jgi:hypothetical protein
MMSATYQKKWREPHGLVKVLITFNNGTADIARHCMTVCTGHFIALVVVVSDEHLIGY